MHKYNSLQSTNNLNRPIDLGILLCDTVDPNLQPEFGDYPRMFYKLLSSDLFSVEIESYNLTQNNFPKTLNECDVWLLTGSSWSAYDEDNWIKRAEQLIQNLHKKQKPTIGICFGHQLICQALGGQVQKAETGWCVGIHDIQIQDQIKKKATQNNIDWMQPFQDQLSLIVSHQDQVYKIPEEMELLGSHPVCPYDFGQVSQHILTMQGHPKFSRQFSMALMEKHQQNLGQSKFENGINSLSKPIDSDIVAQWFQNFLTSSLALKGMDS